MLNKLRSQMVAAGIDPPDSFDVDDALHRFGRKKNSWYALHWFRLDSGEQVLTGRYGDWKVGVDTKVDLDLPPMSDEEKKRLQSEQRRKAQLVATAKREKQADAALRAADIWGKLPDDGHSDYLQRKKVAAVGVRFSRGSIVVPLHKVDGTLVGLQFIAADGSKTFLTGTEKLGAFHVLGVIAPDGKVLVAEGYATAASLHMAMRLPVVCAFDAGNLEPVAKALRSVYPALRMIICADNDWQTKGNPGVNKALAAAQAVGGRVVIPRIPLETASP